MLRPHIFIATRRVLLSVTTAPGVPHIGRAVRCGANRRPLTTAASPNGARPQECKYYFETGYSLFAKRPSKPFPPPFYSPPSGSFSDPLSTHHRSRDRRSYVNGELIRGITNGDDAIIATDHFIGANDGVGAWLTRPRGHAAYGSWLWSRLILHFWAVEIEKENTTLFSDPTKDPDPVACLQRAYEQTLNATTIPSQWDGTTTACAALLYCKNDGPSMLYVTSLGDSQILVIRPHQGEVIYRTKEQWHWFDCPRQLGTNSPDTPVANAIMEKVELQENDVVLAMSDGVPDNLWEHEILQHVLDGIKRWEAGEGGESQGSREGGAGGGMHFIAKDIVNAARVVAEDPFAESPFMERAVEEGLAMEGGKLDDISVVAALCRRWNG